ncbi:MAG: glycosyltransferase family 4 protein [Ignavibacteriales bacterium]|nr:glycosyltransferase family 4 protein [Ignavibacteriales bacterium]
MNELRTKKILYLTKTMNLGGAERFTFELAKHFGRIFSEVVIVSSGGFWESELSKNGIVHIKIPEIGLSKPVNNIRALTIINGLIKKHRFDIIHIQHRIFFIFLPFLFYGKFKSVYTALNVFNGFAQKFITPGTAIGVSKIVTENLLATLPIKSAKINCINFGVHVPQKVISNSIASKHKIRIGYTGRFIKEKGLFVILDALKILLDAKKDAELFLIGAGREQQNILAYINKHNLNHNITLVPPQHNLDSVYELFDIFVLPSVYNEGLPISILEAAAHGKIIITNTVGGITDFVRNNETGFILQNVDAQSLAEKINFAVENPELTQKIKKNAFDLVQEKFSIEKMLEEYEKLYSNVLTLS